MPNRSLVHRKGEPFQLRTGGVHHHETRTPREVEKQAAERLRKRSAGRVAVAAASRRPSVYSVSGRMSGNCPCRSRIESSRTRRNAGQPEVFVLRLVAQCLRRARSVQQPRTPNLLEVVIVTFDPENRDHGLAGPRLEFPGGGDRGHRLDERIERAPEQPGLLAGDDRQCLWIAKPLCRSEDGRVRAPDPVGCPDHPGGGCPGGVGRPGGPMPW